MAQEISIIKCASCGYQGQVLDKHLGYKWWMIAISIPLICTGLGAIPVAIILILLGNQTRRVCPNCHDQDLAPWSGQPSEQNVAAWEKAREADEAAFARNKLVLLTVIMSVFFSVIVYVIVVMNI